MPLALLLLVSLPLMQGCIAPAVSDDTANPASLFLDTNISLASSNSTSDTCKDIDSCRTMVGIVTSCLATIFACVWVAVHPNIPGPNQGRMSRYFESLKLVILTVLVPEWILAWAVRQFLQARYYTSKLESARKNAARTLSDDQNTIHEGNTRKASSINQERNQAPGILLEAMPAAYDNSNKDSTGSVREVRTGELDNEQASPVLRQSLERRTPGPPEPASKLGYLWQLESELGRTNQSWTIAHAFFMISGGFHWYRRGEPMFPLAYDDVLALVASGSLVPPTSGELRDRCKGDALSKTIAVFQALWFVVQCIARRVENLAITNLEIMTLAYTVITVAMYAAWWDKPLNVQCPVRVKGDADGGLPRPFEPSDIIDYVIGDQDYHIRLSGEERVPTFWSSCCHWNSRRPLYADMIALSVAMVFGAVHCAAWSYAFPSLEQQRMWRVCALAIAAIPLPMAAAFAVSEPFFTGTRRGIFNYIQIICMPLGALLYILARMILLVLSFTTLRQLPLSAYQTVQWTTWIPHI